MIAHPGVNARVAAGIQNLNTYRMFIFSFFYLLPSTQIIPTSDKAVKGSRYCFVLKE
jgi:hypothetical protein